MRQLHLHLFCLALAGFIVSGCVTPAATQTGKTQYDRFTDRTTITSDKLTVPSGMLSPIAMAVRFVATCDGEAQTCSNSKVVGLVFENHSAFGWQFLRHHTIVFLADGERIMPENVNHTGRVGRNIVSENITGTLTLDQFERIIAADVVEARLGAHEWEFTHEQILRLRGFANVAFGRSLASE